MRAVGIVGHEAAKFTPETEAKARLRIRQVLMGEWTSQRFHLAALMVSGGCHLGGIDIWAEEEANKLAIAKLVHLPEHRTWARGFKPRNIRIAESSTEVHCLVVAELPSTFTGMRHELCYHCGRTDHVKSGGCWTAKYAERIGRPVYWHIL